MAQGQKQYQDNLGYNDVASLSKYSVAELAQHLGGYREMFADLGAVIQDLDAVGMVGDGSAHPYGPRVLHQINELLHHHHRHAPHSAVTKLLHHLYSVMAQRERLQQEKRLWHGASNVISSVQWVNLAANTVSSVATLRAPYSGVNYMILDILCDTAIMPPGWFTNLSFAGINFANPAQNQVQYSTAAGVLGTPFTQGMGWNAFLQDKTFPDGRRYFNPWVGWILSSDAVSTWAIYNADQAFARTFSFDILMRSSPCEVYYNKGTTMYGWHESELHNHAIDMMFALVQGLHGQPRGTPDKWGWPSHVGVGVPGVTPSGHQSPTGGRLVG